MVNELKRRLSVKKNNSNLLNVNSNKNDHPDLGQFIIKADQLRGEKKRRDKQKVTKFQVFTEHIQIEMNNKRNKEM